MYTFGMYTLSVSEPKVKPVGGFLPEEREMDKLFSALESDIEPQIEEGVLSGVDLTSSYSREVLAQWYVGNGPKGLLFGSNACCHGAGVQVTTYRAYFMERGQARHPDDFAGRYGHYPRIFMRDRGRDYEVHTMRGPYNGGLGRAGGHTGWDKTKDLFAFALTTLKHNFQALLGAFASRPSLPCSEAWHLPNLIHSKYVEDIERRYGCEIVSPPVAVPPASYSFSFTLPTPMMVLVVGTNCPRDTKTYVEFWNANRQNMVDPYEVTFPRGESETVFTLRVAPPAMIQKGFFNINPVNSEMTVSYVRVMFPPR